MQATQRGHDPCCNGTVRVSSAARALQRHRWCLRRIDPLHYKFVSRLHALHGSSPLGFLRGDMSQFKWHLQSSSAIIGLAGPQVMRRKVGKQLAPQWVASRAAKPQLSDLWRAKEQVTSALDTRPLPVPSTITGRNLAQQIARQILRGSR